MVSCSIGVRRFASSLLSAPALPTLFRDTLLLSLFFSLSLSSHGNTGYDECDAAGTHLAVLLWIQRSNFFVFRSKWPD